MAKGLSTPYTSEYYSRLFYFRKKATYLFPIYQSIPFGFLKLFKKVLHILFLKASTSDEVSRVQKFSNKIKYVFVVITKNHARIAHEVLKEIPSHTILIIGTKNHLNAENFVDWRKLENGIFIRDIALTHIRFLNLYNVRDLDRILFIQKVNQNIKALFESFVFEKFVFFGDHDYVSSHLLLYAKCFLPKVQTVYIQHGFTTESFPPILFDQFFSYGKSTVQKYQFLNPKCEVFTCGKVFTEYSKQEILPKDNSSNVIGISVNLLDDISKIESFVRALNEFFECKIIIRPHPGMGEFKLKSIVPVEYDHSSTLQSYFGKLTHHYSGISSVHLDSLFFEVPSAFINFSKKNINDYYGFIESGLIQQCDSQNPRLPVLVRDKRFRELAESFLANIYSKENPASFISKKIMYG